MNSLDTCLAEDGVQTKLDKVLLAIFLVASMTDSQVIQSLASLLVCHLFCFLLPSVLST